MCPITWNTAATSINCLTDTDIITNSAHVTHICKGEGEQGTKKI